MSLDDGLLHSFRQAKNVLLSRELHASFGPGVHVGRISLSFLRLSIFKIVYGLHELSIKKIS